jgi:hypothetical protein
MPGAKQNQQKREESGQTMTIVHGDGLHKMWKAASKDRQKSEIALSMHAATNQLMWCSKQQMGEQSVLWRDLKREGKVEILEGNCVAREDKLGRTWNLLVVQPTNLEHAPIDKVALMEFGFAVSGYVYFFKSVENRDEIRRFVMEI